VKPTNANAGAIAAVEKLGIFEGDANGKFNPSSPITRAQIAKVLVLAFGLENQGEAVAFSDVPQNNWASHYVSILASNGVTNGDGDGSFGSDELLKINQLKVFIERIQQ